MKYIYSLGIVIFFLLLNFSCQKDNKNYRKDYLTKEQEKFEKREDFNIFFNNFFSSKTFQMSRINFPLQGNDTDYVFDINYSNDTIAENYIIKNKIFYWRKEGWNTLQKFPLITKEYETKFTYADEKVSVVISYKKENYKITMIFKIKENNLWFLDFYSSEWY